MDMQAYQMYYTADLETEVANASSAELVMMLMTRLLDEIARARAHIVARRYEAKGRSIIKCIDILAGLAAALDFDTGGEAAANMARFYERCIWRLSEAGIRLEVEPLDAVAQQISALESGWREVAHANDRGR